MCLCKHSSSFLGGIILGAAVGAVLALLYAPASGEETRKMLKKKSKDVKKKVFEVKDQIVDGIDELKEKAGGEVKNVEKKAKKIVRDFKKSF